MSRLAAAVVLHNAALQSAAGVAVTYRRDSSTVDVTAIPGSTDFEIVGPDGVAEQFQSRDWLIEATDLVISSTVVLPAKGDEIDETVGAETHTYRVLSPGGGAVYRFSDQYRKVLRIHTKLVETA